MASDAAKFPGVGHNLNGDTVNNGPPPVPTPAREDIEEDSCIWKILALIPIFGIFPQMVQEDSLGLGINGFMIQPTRERRIAIIEVKNEYKILGLVRSALTIAILVAQVALGIIPLVAIIAPTVLFGILGFMSWSALSHNQQLLEQLRSDNPPAQFLVR